MTRLINDMRISIISGMLEHAFAARAIALMKRQAVIAACIYNKTYGLTGLKRLADAPEGWYPKNSSMKISIVGKSEYTKSFTFSGAFIGSSYAKHDTEAECHFILSKEDRPSADVYERVPYKHNGSAIVLNLDPSDPLAVDAVKWIDDQRELSSQIVEARKLASVTMDNFTTVEKLIESWPAAAPFAERWTPPAPVQLPAIPIDKLNGMLGLPVTE